MEKSRDKAKKKSKKMKDEYFGRADKNDKKKEKDKRNKSNSLSKIKLDNFYASNYGKSSVRIKNPYS